ncbi:MULTISPECIES: phosphoribosylanthranilate isomerase [unclassified Crossiella]|uniref:phosphoribosylanthranilate isomerase n=1 Tax=unclassified Crossiella TaxID=2620835 RepID=UPI001FFF3D81|nr:MULTISPECIES: phosphoribosylanthranilate isomerase [unclassified Crossiella]MCK2244529.1 phosphoribosylanthranilate isomerase [Crossiella sp. S99.2]MCK2258160.1 phosphoribosylanthranilate isomerase [Crossiella sp. S99.1]
MGTRTAVKICGLTRPDDVDAAVEAGADAIGFVLYPPSPRYVTPERAAELAARLPAFVTPVLLFVNAPAAEVLATAAAVPGALVQFHGDETPADCWAATGQGRLAFLRAARIPLDPGTPPFDLTGFARRFDRARAILLDAHVPGYGGGGRTFDWSLLPAAPEEHLVLSGGLTPGNVAEGIRTLRPLCRTLSVDVSSGVEAAKGVKDHNKIREFITAVRNA